jgi:transposase-like protein
MKDFARNTNQIPLADGGTLMPLNLPPANTVRWVARRKAEVVAAVHAGALSMMEACRRYRLSPEEFLEWERRYRADEGLAGASRPRRALH